MKFPIMLCFSTNDRLDGPHHAEVTITGTHIKIDNICECNAPKGHMIVSGEFEDISGNDSAIVLKITNKDTSEIKGHVVFVGMDVGSPFASIATAKLAYVY